MEKKYFSFFLFFLTMATLSFSFASCSSDDENSGNGSSSVPNQDSSSIVINADGTTSTGSKFVAIDANTFYIDYIKYSINQGHLEVTGFDKIGFAGNAKFYSIVTYKGTAYDVLAIGKAAFDHCDNLKSVVIPKGIKLISESAFEDCHNLISVSISESVETINTRALHGCKTLRDVHCKRQTPPTVLGSSTNGGTIEYLTNSEVYLNATLYVPQGTLSAYKDKNGWKEFGNIIEE